MADKFGFEEEEVNVLVPNEPQISSHDPEERKAARALRIKRRQEAIAKKAEQALHADEPIPDEEPGIIEQTTAEAAEELQRLALDGATKVTNVKVSTDEREVMRRNECARIMREILNTMEQEAADALVQYEVISENWVKMLTIKDPLDIDEAIKAQKVKCDNLLIEKDEMIAILKDELKRMDIAYFEDLKKQDHDIKELSDRIEKQITIMQRAYEKQLYLIEKAIEIDRDGHVEHNNKRWEALYKKRNKEELAHMGFKADQLDVHKQEIEAIMWDHHEKYREAKIELETLLQELQKELEKLKATCLINTEKIGYTYQVLKKREEENIFVRSQQKRKLNKMADIANALRAKIRKAADDGAQEEVRADAEIVKLMQMMDELEKKSYHFAHVNDYKFSQVWRMSVAKCLEMLRELRDAEVALHAHILAEAAPPPPPPPPKTPLNKQLEESEKDHQLECQYATNPASDAIKESKDTLVRHILQLVADNTGFLVEDRLLTLIAKYPLTSRNLCTLDSIFMALEIQAEKDVELLCKTFMNYAFCPICVGMGDGMTSEVFEQSIQDQTCKTEPQPRGRASSLGRARASIARSLSVSTTRSAHVGFRGHELTQDDHILMAEADEIMQKCGDLQAQVHLTGAASDAGGSLSVRRGGPRGVTVNPQLDIQVKPAMEMNPFVCSLGHMLEIEPMQVLTALGEFISIFVSPEKEKLNEILDYLKPPNFSTPSRRLNAEDIEKYWAQWLTMFPPEKDRFWNGLITGLNSYLHALQERERLHEEVVLLRRRNAGLRRLVRGALPELSPARPHYAGPPPRAFTATTQDQAPYSYVPTRLPPI